MEIIANNSTYMSRQSVIRSTHKSCFIILISVLSHVSKHCRGDGKHHHQHPHAYEQPPHNLPAEAGRHSPGQH